MLPAGRPTIVRVNAQGTAWYLDDLAAVVGRGPAAILLPKCTGPGDLLAACHHLDALEAAAGLGAGSVGLLALADRSRDGSTPTNPRPTTG